MLPGAVKDRVVLGRCVVNQRKSPFLKLLHHRLECVPVLPSLVINHIGNPFPLGSSLFSGKKKAQFYQHPPERKIAQGKEAYKN